MKHAILKEVSGETITLLLDGQLLELNKKLSTLQQLLEQHSVQQIQTADKIYNIGTITNANFDYFVGQASSHASIKEIIALHTEEPHNWWIESVKRAIVLKEKVPVGTTVQSVFQRFGWLIEASLYKIAAFSKEKSLATLSYIIGTFQSSLRYLCFIQIAQLLKLKPDSNFELLRDFFHQQEKEYLSYDYLNLLLLATSLIPKGQSFVPEIESFVEALKSPEEDLHWVGLYLEKQRVAMQQQRITENEAFPMLLEESLSGLVYWMQQLSFLARYRLVSIKDIMLQYRLGSAKNFIHIYGELHGFYNEQAPEVMDYQEMNVEGLFTYNHSVLLFNGSNMDTCLNNLSKENAYLSLTPFIIDESVFSEKLTQTPEIYYFTGYSARKYHFASHKNELPIGAETLRSNQSIQIKATNNNFPKRDSLFEQMEQIFSPLKSVN